MKTVTAAALFALVSVGNASAFDNQTCQAFLTGLWIGDDGDDSHLTMAAMSKDGQGLMGFGPVPAMSGKGNWIATEWTAKPGTAPERCILVTTKVDRNGKESHQEQELSVVDDNTINIYDARMYFRRQ